MFPVSPEKNQALAVRMAGLGIKDGDLKETFVRSRGNGGQNVNKVSSCVVLVHLPTGLAVKCQKDRSQGMNRFFARRLLCDRIEAAQGLGQDPKARQEAKQRKQKDRRARRSREKLQPQGD